MRLNKSSSGTSRECSASAAVVFALIGGMFRRRSRSGCRLLGHAVNTDIGQKGELMIAVQADFQMYILVRSGDSGSSKGQEFQGANWLTAIATALLAVLEAVSISLR